MTWTAYRIVFRLISPLHVGWIKVGNLQRTRLYVPAKTVWGALTARLTRDVPAFGGDYQTVGARVREELAFSYLFPALDPQKPLYPHFTEQGLQYGEQEMEPDEFAWRLLSSYASTAIDAGRDAAEEGSLHETEFLSPYDREMKEPVYLTGYVFEREGCKLPWKNVLNRLQLGGERRYGWGRIACYKIGDPIQGKIDIFHKYPVDLGEDEIKVDVPEKASLLAHTVTDKNMPVIGQIEPVVGRETSHTNRFGAYISTDVKICWVPGSVVENECRLIIRPDGLWEQCSAE